MREISLETIRLMAEEFTGDKIYIHWSAGKYNSFFDDYHINVDHDGTYHTSVETFEEGLNHTWSRNAGSIGIALACCYNANTNDAIEHGDFGAYPPTEAQAVAVAKAIATICDVCDLDIDEAVMTHCEAADEDGYGPHGGGCQRWDLWLLPWTLKGEGGTYLRALAKQYLEEGV